MSGRPSDYFDNRMQMEGALDFRCRKCGIRVRKHKVFDTLAPQDSHIRDALRPLLAVEVERWKESNKLFCDGCRPPSFRADKWPDGGEG